VEDMGKAVWWPSTDARSGADIRHLEGEIKLAKDLRPTSEMAHFSISVRNPPSILFLCLERRVEDYRN